MGITFLGYAVYSLLASSIRRYVIESPRALVALRRCFAVAFAGMAVQLAITEQ